MREQPTGDKLLESARSLLRDELIPALPPDKRHSALMIANALGIAARQLKNGDVPAHQEVIALEGILGAQPASGSAMPASLEQRLDELNRQLCQRIRQGIADSGDARDSVRAHLLHTARHRVAESNPKFLVGAR